MYELASKEIVELFLGDKEINMYIDEVYVRYSMPNLTHSDINSLAPTFGINNIDTVLVICVMKIAIVMVLVQKEYR